MQKVAETSSSSLGRRQNLFDFIVAVGITVTVSSILAFSSIKPFEEIGKYVQSLGFGLLLMLVIGIILIGLAYLFTPKRNQHDTCDKIILKAERRIQTLNKEAKKEY
ncbi:MAG: hypothetical protein O8C61_01705 [Candidatus Methanoperedens sp.]|nr:hypothetical protein [Candidatus Methanoperedens sp.]